MFALLVAALVCSLSVGRWVLVPCEDLLRPVDRLGFRDLEGTWALVAATVNDEAHMETLRGRDSASVSFANDTGTSEVTFTRVFSEQDSCQYMQSNIVINGSGFFYPKLNVTATLLATSCPDCFAVHYARSDRPSRFYLFSRRREVKPEELQEFRTQAECLKLPAPVVLDPTKELCPEKASADPAAPTEAAAGQKA